jgi:ankyrin repeat/BTB/POZ domain-containing protein 1
MDARAFEIVVKYLYLADVKESNDDQVMVNLEHLSRKFEIEELWDEIMMEDRKKRKQKRTEAVEKAQEDMARWWERVLGERIEVPDSTKAMEVRVEQSNAVFADVVLMAEEDPEDEGGKQAAVLYPVHKGLLRSEYFAAMFNGMFREGQRLEEGEPLKIIPMDMTPAVLELVLSFLYSEKVDIPIEHALDCLMAAEELLLDRLKQKCSHVISSAGNNDDLPYSIYDVIRTGWLTRVRRLEEFGAKYIADRLELYLNDPELPELVAESADRIKARQETDTIEVVDDIRYYLGLRFKQRIGEEDPLFEGGLEDEEEEEDKDAVDDKDGWFEKQEKLQGELLDRIDELLGRNDLGLEVNKWLTVHREFEIGRLEKSFDLKRIDSGISGFLKITSRQKY